MTMPPNPPPPAGGYGGAAPSTSNYLVPSILVTLFCCLPFGIVAIVNSAKVNGLLASGDYSGAQAAADAAKKWCIWAAVAGVIIGVIYLILVLAGGITLNAST